MAQDEELIESMGRNDALRGMGISFLRETAPFRYTYHFQWLGRPIIQMPQDIVAIQEIVWRVRPRAIVETGIAHGGSLVLSASLLELLGGDGIAIGIDIEIREHNRKALQDHALAARIRMLEGSSTDPAVAARARDLVGERKPVVVILDSNHTHAHVMQELRMYAPLVGKGSYVIVLDTAIEDMPQGTYPDRPWGKGNNPRTAVGEFLKENRRFVVDAEFRDKLVISTAPDGYLKCIEE